ncbi:hypothetical protein LENED_007809 [Lentinula edodes]|uniref:Uncharacterized protein n=1 Tax=Lentinula edodes TaxID=5353 RepID=A0A1Q3EFF6_LENED|nr:hypothetical protein LENED_007809 [Lentinula edodes]
MHKTLRVYVTYIMTVNLCRLFLDLIHIYRRPQFVTKLFVQVRPFPLLRSTCVCPKKPGQERNLHVRSPFHSFRRHQDINCLNLHLPPWRHGA